MGLLDEGLQQVFGSVFAEFLPSGVLFEQSLLSDGKGGFAKAKPIEHAISGMVDTFNQYIKRPADVPASDSMLLVLQDGVPVQPKVGWEIYLDGRRWKIVKIGQDPAKAAWTLQCTQIG